MEGLDLRKEPCTLQFRYLAEAVFRVLKSVLACSWIGGVVGSLGKWLLDR